MVAIPQYKKQVNLSHEQYGYYRANANPDAFGASTAKALQNLGDSVNFFAKSMSDMYDDLDQIRQLEFSNYIDELERTDLNDPENGYYSKLGKDAMADPNNPESGAHGVMSSIEQKINQKQQELGLTWGRGAIKAYDTKAKKMKMLYDGATSHEIKETQNWQNATLQEATNAALTKGILHRDSEDEMNIALGNGLATIINKAALMHLDQDSTRIKMAEFKSEFYSGVLNAYLQDGSLKASDFYKKHKEELLPEAQAKYFGQVKNNERNYIARSVSDRLYNLYPEDEASAYAEVDKIENAEERNAVESRLTALYSRQKRVEEAEQNNLMDKMWEDVANKLKNNQVPSEDDIPYGLNGKNWLNARNAINQLINKGDIDTDNSAYIELYELRNTDAQKFANMNLTEYRALLSNADYKAFQKMQVDIKNMTPTQLNDQDEAVKNGLKMLGYTYDKKGMLETKQFLNNDSWGQTRANANAYINSANAYIRELELKKGKNLTQGEKNTAMKEFAQSYTYKDKKGAASDLYQEGMNRQVGFMRNVLNDFITAEKAKGSPLTNEERYKIVADRVSKTTQEENANLSRSGLRPAAVGDIWHGHRITSVYGERTAPTKGASTNHKGVDLAYNYNEKFPAFASGTVVNVGRQDAGYGNYLDIKGEDGVIHRYAHANSFIVKKGQKVQEGDYIGRAGNTGISTGSHLHYERIENGKSVDPLNRSNTTNLRQIVMKDNKGNRALVQVDTNGKPVKVIREL